MIDYICYGTFYYVFFWSKVFEAQNGTNDEGL